MTPHQMIYAITYNKILNFKINLFQFIFDILTEYTESELSKKQSEKSSDNEEEESEIVITSEQFKSKLKKIFTQLNEYLKYNKVEIRELFGTQIFRPTFDDPPMECNEDAIFLKPFIDMLKTIEISLDTVDIYCVYTRLKIVENSEAISINQLEKELKSIEQYNEILDSLSSNNVNQNQNSSKESKSIEQKLNNNRLTSQESKISNQNKETESKKNFKNEIAVIDDESDSDPVEFDDSDSKIEYESSNEKAESK